MPRATVQFILSLGALGALLAAPASQATNLADRPLKASVLAKPNVIFGMDDSGSMDWEVLLDTSSGLVWWNGTSAWNTATGKPLASNGSFVAYPYLMPVGTASGGQIYAYNNTFGRALPPINQFAWLRSSRFNPIYYNTLVSYAPWSPAYVGGALRTYANASTTAASSHPTVATAPTLAIGADWNSGSANFNSNGYRFYVQQGMVLPVGARLLTTNAGAAGVACSGGTERTLTAAQTVLPGNACYASIPYFPATFWHAENCTVGTNCVNRPDGAGTLRRYEIRSGNTFPSGRSAADELQNFANWFTYYRKRKLMLAGSMGQVMEDISGLRMGVVPFNDHVAVSMYDADATAAASNRLAVAGKFYTNSMVSAGTPTHATMKHIGDQFNANTNIVQYACQRNNSFIVTDGFSNTTSITPPSWDSGKSAATWGAGAPYQTTANGTQADLALRHYTNRLRAGTLAAGRVPVSGSTAPNADQNPDLHVNTYGITLGVRGTLWPSASDPFTTAPTWTTPVADDPSLIDDLWHATINGRGKMYLASSPEETANSIRAGLDDILSNTGAQGGVAVSTVNLSRGDSRAYFGAYDPAGWAGDLTAKEIDPQTGIVGVQVWSASALLLARDWTTRIIAAATNVGVGFTEADVGALVNPGGVYGTTAQVMNYLRGDRSGESTDFRKRKSLMGAVINSEPAISRDDNLVYVQSGEGMLHAFDITKDANSGREMWAFVPRVVLGSIGQTTQRSYAFGSELDGSPVVAKSGASSKVLIAGMGVAGRSYYALDVTSPRNLSEVQLAGKYLWEFPASGDATTQAKLGQAVGKPAVVKTADDGYVALLTSGYNSSADGKGRLWMVNPATGAIIHEFTVADGTLAAESGLAQVAAFGETNGTVRYVYGGDLLGNVWRFDLKLKDAPFKLAVLKNASGQLQPVTAAPELITVAGKRVAIVGTGRLLDITDFASTQVQSIYVIADGSFLPNARTSLVPQVYSGHTLDNLTSTPVDWASDRGWYLDLPVGEQINSRPTIAYGAVAFVGNITGGTDCSAASYLYVLDVVKGTRYAGTDFTSTLISDSANSSAVTALRTVDGKIVGSGQDADGNPWERKISNAIPITPAKNSWTEIRR